MKTTPYFSHDYNAQEDEKIIRLRKDLDWYGYGLYWGIIEKLYASTGRLPLDYDFLAFVLRAEMEKIKQIICQYGLFYEDGKSFGCRTVDKRLALRESISKERAKAGAIGGMAKNTKANARQMPGNSRVNIKVNIKKKEKKKDSPAPTALEPDFESFWRAYPRKKAKVQALKAWGKISEPRPPLAIIISALESQITNEGWDSRETKYIPHPATWINGRRWEDETVVQSTNGDHPDLPGLCKKCKVVHPWTPECPR